MGRGSRGEGVEGFEGVFEIPVYSPGPVKSGCMSTTSHYSDIN